VAALCNQPGIFFLSRWTEVTWKFGRFSVTEVPLGIFLMGQETKKCKKINKNRNLSFLFNLVV
jgi:hypothetical protein